MSKDLLYRPQLGYDKEYYTEGTLYKDNENTNIENDANKESISKEDIIDNLIKDINDKLTYLPDSIINTYLPPYLGMLDEYDRVTGEHDDPETEDPEDPEEPPIKPPEYEIEDPEPDDPDKLPDFFGKEEDIMVDFEDIIKDPVDIIKENYYVDFLDVHEDYLNKILIAIQDYILTTIQITSENVFNLNEPINSTKELKNKDLAHLTDFIIKSNIVLGQTLRMHRKLYDIDEAILHIKGIRISKEQSLRYNAIPEMEEKNLLDRDANILLKESKIVSEKKYEENFYSLYKYLNSSVILLDESLKTITRQNKANIIINNKEERN